MRIAITLLLIVLLVACVTPEPTPEVNLPENITERINEEVPPIEEIPVATLGERIITNQTIIEKGVAITLEGVYRNTEEQRIYIIVHGEDRYENPEKRDATQWQAAFYFTRQEYSPLFLCDYEQQEKSWDAIYCEEERNIPENWYNQKLWLIYTLQEPNLYNQRTSILELLREENLYAFKINLPRP
ncbi:MAG TPA: hypothetical protein VJB87_05435 [Candidatus Nanoarchaeia archaeon]|nr:hypothetical protein [Candidatus Nanoarchaeia archaeon]